MRKLIISLAAAPAITRTALQLPISQRVTRRTYGQAPRLTSYARQGRQEPALENHPDREPFRRISREGSSQRSSHRATDSAQTRGDFAALQLPF